MLTPNEQDSLKRLIGHAKGSGAQSAKVANFLLAWWNANQMGKFDVRELWSLDEQIATDIVAVFNFIANHCNVYPDSLGYEDEFKYVIALHR